VDFERTTRQETYSDNPLLEKKGDFPKDEHTVSPWIGTTHEQCSRKAGRYAMALAYRFALPMAPHAMGCKGGKQK